MNSARSWAVAAACCWINVFTFAIVRAAAVIYVAVLQTFDASREDASWAVSLTVVFYYIAAPVAGVMGGHFEIWKLILAGCLTSSLAVSACYFANGIAYLTVFLGVLHGMSIALLSLCYTVMNRHFLRYKAVASGLGNAGFTIGSLILPPVVQFLFDEYGTRGAFLLYGAIMLNASAGAFLQRPPCRSQQASCEPFANVTCITGSRDPQLQAANLVEVPGFRPDDEETMKKRLLTRAPGMPGNETYVVGASDSDKMMPMTKGSKLFEFLRLPRFYLVTYSSLQVCNNMTLYATLYLDFAMDRDILKWGGVFVMTFYSIADLAARFGSGWITDKRLLSRSSMMACNYLLWSASLCLMPLCYSYHLQVLLSMAAGWCNGATFILIAVLLMELVDADMFSVCFGVSSLLAGLPLLLRPLLIGYFRDCLGDYQGLFQLMGAFTASTAIVWSWIAFKEQI
ncbi:unnamed protein product, partial [Ixodes hexagonus]